MRFWYYAANGKEVGPIAESDLVQLFVQDRLRASNLVWTEGLEDWQPASNFESLFVPQADSAAPDDGEEEWYKAEDGEWYEGENVNEDAIEWEPSEPASDQQPSQDGNITVRPWARFFARKIDISLVFLGLDFLYLTFEASAWSSSFYQGAFLILGFLCLEPLLLVSFGTTPGKFILGLHLHDAQGGSISYSKAFRRTLKVFLRGLALGIPILQLIAQLESLRDLNRNGETAWDREEGFVMEYKNYSIGRVFLTVAILAALGLFTVSFGLR